MYPCTVPTQLGTREPTAPYQLLYKPMTTGCLYTNMLVPDPKWLYVFRRCVCFLNQSLQSKYLARGYDRHGLVVLNLVCPDIYPIYHILQTSTNISYAFPKKLLV